MIVSVELLRADAAKLRRIVRRAALSAREDDPDEMTEMYERIAQAVDDALEPDLVEADRDEIYGSPAWREWR